jgi:hypothetical protein
MSPRQSDNESCLLALMEYCRYQRAIRHFLYFLYCTSTYLGTVRYRYFMIFFWYVLVFRDEVLLDQQRDVVVVSGLDVNYQSKLEYLNLTQSTLSQ